MADAKKSLETGQQDVVDRLKLKAARGLPTSAQIFVKDSVPASEIPSIAESIVSSACKSLNLSPDSVRIGKVRNLAKSFSVTSDVAGLFDAIAKQSNVKSMLDSEQQDILPHPVRRKLVG